MSRSPTPDPEPTTLEDAVQTSHPERLVETILEVCEKSAEAKAIVSGLLLSDIKPDSIKDKDKLEKLAGQKRKRWEACEMCDEEFDVEDNDSKACSWHEGELKLNKNADIWKKGGLEADSDVEPEELAQEYPEAVIFTCCKGKGNNTGCKTGKHRIMSAEKMAKFARMFGQDDDSEDADSGIDE